jgi:hypothetical protein
LLVHSGLQFGGEPKNSGRQEQDGKSSVTRHSEFGPQGDGKQGLIITGVVNALKLKKYIIIKYYRVFFCNDCY